MKVIKFGYVDYLRLVKAQLREGNVNNHHLRKEVCNASQQACLSNPEVFEVYDKKLCAVIAAILGNFWSILPSFCEGRTGAAYINPFDYFAASQAVRHHLLDLLIENPDTDPKELESAVLKFWIENHAAYEASKAAAASPAVPVAIPNMEHLANPETGQTQSNSGNTA